MNWHLRNEGSSRQITNLGKDLADGEVYTLVLHSIDPTCIDKTVLSKDANERAKAAISACAKLGFQPFITPKNIVSGNVKLNTVFAAEIFNHRHGLPPLDAEQ